MRRAFTLLTAMLLLLESTQAFGADKRKIKWIRSVYVDAQGVGLKHPEGVACTDESFVVADTGNGRLLRYSYQDDVVTPESEFPVDKSSPIKVQLNAAGDVYFLDGRERQIMHVGASGGEPARVDLDSVPSKAEIVPKSFAIGADDRMYILDIFSENVLILDPSGQYERQVSFPKEYGFIGDIAVDSRGKVFLIDSVSAVVHTAALGEKRFSPLTESLNDYMNFPARLAVDEIGVIYLVDQNGSGLALVGQDGVFLGRKLAMGWKESGLFYPSQICISPSGNIFIADRNNSRIQLFRTGGGKTAADADESSETDSLE